VGLDRAGAEHEALGDARVRAPLGHQPEDLALALAEVVDRAAVAAAADERRDNVRVDDGASLADAPDRSRERRSCVRLRLLEDRATGRGYLLKDRVNDLEAFAASIRRVGEGGSVVDPDVVRGARRPPPRTAARSTTLSEREREILGLMAEGRSNPGISERLVLSPRTVETHVAPIFRKLDLVDAVDDHRRVLAVLAYLRAAE